MTDMGQYCKAYLAHRFRDYPGWTENLASLELHKKWLNGKEVEEKRTELNDEDVLYLQENFVVTDGTYKDQNIIFDAVTEAWKSFCREHLGFQPPGSALDATDTAK